MVLSRASRPWRGRRRAGPASAAAGIALMLFTAPLWALQAGQASSAYRIGPKDLVSIQVFEIPELTVDLRVSEEGMIDLPLVGSVEVRGLTVDELAAKLKSLLELRYVQRASVRVEVKEFRSRPISVIGAVKNPGPLAFSGRWTLLEALTAAGGLVPGHGNVIYILRTASNGLSDQIEIRVDELMLRADPRLNVPIFASDIINVPAPMPVVLFCLGEVARPGALQFASNERVTVLSAIARAGGLTDRASNKILIKRRDGSGKESEIRADYKRIIGQQDPDLGLQANDVIVVKSSFF